MGKKSLWKSVTTSTMSANMAAALPYTTQAKHLCQEQNSSDVDVRFTSLPVLTSLSNFILLLRLETLSEFG